MQRMLAWLAWLACLWLVACGAVPPTDMQLPTHTAMAAVQVPSSTNTPLATTTPSTTSTSAFAWTHLPIQDQGDMRAGFGESYANLAALPGWAIRSETDRMTVQAVAAGVVRTVDITNMADMYTAQTVIVDFDAQYAVEYLLLPQLPGDDVVTVAVAHGDRLGAGDRIMSARMHPEGVLIVSLIDRVRGQRSCPHDFIAAAVRETWQQPLRRLMRDWCALPAIADDGGTPLIAQLGAGEAQTPTPASAVTATVVVATPSLGAPTTTPSPNPAVPTALPTATEPAASPTVLAAQTTELPVFRLPVADINAVRIMEAYSTSADAPWKFAHNGIDFMTSQAREPIYAVSAGTVQRVELERRPPLNNWQVGVIVRVNDQYNTVYTFEPMTADDAIGQQQREAVLVTPGQQLQAGDMIGELIGGKSGAHLHWGVVPVGASAICPAPFFTAETIAQMLARIPSGASQLCYP